MTNLEIPEGTGEIVLGKKNIVMDATILTSLMKCPRLCDFRFNHHLIGIGGKSNSFECGSIVHTFTKYYYGALIKGLNKEQATGFGLTAAEMYIKGCPTCTDFKATPETPKPICNHKVNEFPGVKNTPRESEKEPFARTGWSWVLKTCEEYATFYRNDHWVPLEIDTVKGEVLFEDDEIRILWKAQIDLIMDSNQGIFPVDHKTMKQNRPTKSLNNQFIGQALLLKTRNVFIDKIGFQTTLPADKKFIRQPVSYSAERLLEWQSETLPFYAKLLLMYVETGHFPPNYESCESRYGFCDFIKVCEANPAMRNEEIKNGFIVGPEWNPTNDEGE